MKKAVFAGSFDPITNGHIDILKQALKDFDEVTLLVAINKDKKYMFSLHQRLRMLKKVIKDENLSDRVKVAKTRGLTVDFAKKIGTNYLIRGIRNQDDEDYELHMAVMNRALNTDIETKFYYASPDLVDISSTNVKKMHLEGKDISSYVPQVVVKSMKNKK